jgi:hypothetical protein
MAAQPKIEVGTKWDPQGEDSNGYNDDSFDNEIDTATTATTAASTTGGDARTNAGDGGDDDATTAADELRVVQQVATVVIPTLTLKNLPFHTDGVSADNIHVQLMVVSACSAQLPTAPDTLVTVCWWLCGWLCGWLCW